MNWVHISEFKPKKGVQYLYVFDFGGVCKIGRSFKPSERSATVKTSSGRNYFGGWCLDGDYCAVKAEALAHKQMREHRGIGEWFSVTADEVIENLEIDVDVSEFRRKKKKSADQILAELEAHFNPQMNPGQGKGMQS